MGTSTDWAFDVYEHVIDRYAEALDFTPDEPQRYPDRITGTVHEGPPPGLITQRAVIIPKPVGHDNATRYRRWVTLPPVHWQNLTNRPAGWRYFILMVGLLPDGQPWWSALYEESTLAELRDHSESMPGFYRFDPGLTAKALIADWDKDRPDGYRDSPAQYTATLGDVTVETGDQADFMASIWDFAATRQDNEPITGRIDVAGNEMSVVIE